ncbi:MAG: hypothetical protein M1575_03685 [Patescibacteria group bacterium]|nr:hypothetical protein [Patescibacteria group bacterium]MCL5095793.1 hypothetical protein [Patescibacteria group bacterium]
MTAEQFLMILVSWWPWIYIKLFLLILLGLYLIFAGICFRQIDLMNQMVEAKISPALRFIGLLHLLAAMTIFILTLTLL